MVARSGAQDPTYAWPAERLRATRSPQAVGQTPVPAGGGSRQTPHETPAACRNRTHVTSVVRHPRPDARHRHPSSRQWRSRPPPPRSRRAKRRRSTVWSRAGARRSQEALAKDLRNGHLAYSTCSWSCQAFKQLFCYIHN
jgi:hypothetical protein